MGHLHPLADYYLTQIAKGLFLEGLDQVCFVCVCVYVCVHACLMCVCTRIMYVPPHPPINPTTINPPTPPQKIGALDRPAERGAATDEDVPVHARVPRRIAPLHGPRDGG